MKVVIKTMKSFEIFDLDDVLFIQAKGSYSLIKKINGDVIKVSKNMLALTSLFKNYDRLRKCHRSYFANTGHISAILFLSVRKYRIVFNNKEMIPISLNYKKNFMSFLEEKYLQAEQD